MFAEKEILVQKPCSVVGARRRLRPARYQSDCLQTGSNERPRHSCEQNVRFVHGDKVTASLSEGPLRVAMGWVLRVTRTRTG